MLVFDGNCEEAAKMALACLKLARHAQRNPSVVGYLVAVTIQGVAISSANDALQKGAVSKEVRDALEAELAIQEPMDSFVWALKSERAFVVDSSRNIAPLRNFWLITRGFWNMHASACLDDFPAFIELASHPGPYRDVEQTIQGKKSPLAVLLFPALKTAYMATTRMRAEIRCLRVLIALQTHVRAGSNEVPKLSELGLPAEATTDPFTGEPLHVNKTPQGWLVYSVGPNLRDDGGKLDNPYNGDVGVGPPPAEKPAKK